MKHIIFFLFLIPAYIFGQWQWFNIEYNNVEMRPLEDIYFRDSLRGIAAGSGYTPLVTYDGGVKWYYPQLLNLGAWGKFYFISKDVGFCVAYNLVKTTDFGESWKKVTPEGYHDFRDMHFVNDSTGYVVAKDGEIFITHDAGEHWEDISFEKNNNLYYFSIHFSDSQNGWIYGKESYKGVFSLKTTNAGHTWNKTSLHYPETIIFKKQFVNPNTGYGIYYSTYRLAKSTDGGNSWTECKMPQGDVKLSSLYFLDENTGYISGKTVIGYEYGRVFKTTDGCKTWKTIYSTNIPSVIEHIFFVDENHGWASTGYGILRTTNGGTTFIQERESTELRTSLISNYPNPFNGYTTIQYTLRESGTVKIYLYDILGREMKQIVNEYKSAGEYKLSFNAGDLPSGTYYYCLNTGDFVQYRSMLLLK